MSSAELQSRTQIFNHHAPNFSEIHTHVRIDAMTEEEKWHWLSKDILTMEHQYLRETHGLSQKRPESAIIFLTGGKTGDVTEERDFEGNLIHTRHLDRPRPMFAEIPEARSAISHWFDLVRQSQDLNTPMPTVIPVISEITDVVYNVSHLLTLDPSFQNEYSSYISMIAESLGFTVDQLLTLTMYKYNFRLGQGKSQKNIAIENDLLERVMTKADAGGKPAYPTPTESQMQMTFRTLKRVETLLDTRWEQLHQKHDWKKNPVTSS